MVSIARLRVVNQSFFGLPGQYGCRVTRVNREPVNSTCTWRQIQALNPGHVEGWQVLPTLSQTPFNETVMKLKCTAFRFQATYTFHPLFYSASIFPMAWCVCNLLSSKLLAFNFLLFLIYVFLHSDFSGDLFIYLLVPWTSFYGLSHVYQQGITPCPQNYARGQDTWLMLMFPLWHVWEQFSTKIRTQFLQ